MFLFRKFYSLLLVAVLLLNNAQNVLAAENEPVANAEVILTVLGPDGNLIPISGLQPVQTAADGSFNIDLPAGISEHEPIFAVVQNADGSGVQNISCVSPKEPAQVDSASTAIGNAFLSLANESEDFNPADADAAQVEKFVKTMKEAIKDVPVADNAADSVIRFADAMSLRPNAFLEAAGDINMDPVDLLKVASQINKAAAPENHNPLDGPPPKLPDEIAPGSVGPGLISEEFIKKHTARGFDFNQQFGDDLMPPGGLEGEVPNDAFLMPSGLRANPNAKFPDAPVFPTGTIIPGEFVMPNGAVLVPGVIVEGTFVPPPNFPFPPGVLTPADYDPEALGGKRVDAANIPDNYEPSPGFALVDGNGGVGMPADFPLPGEVFVPDNVFEFPPQEGHKPPIPKEGFEAGRAQPMGEGFAFQEGARLPRGYDPAKQGLVPQEGFQGHRFGQPSDVEQFRDPNFDGGFDPRKGHNPDDPTGGFRGPPLDENGVPIPGHFDPNKPPPEGHVPGTIPDDFDAFAPQPKDGKGPKGPPLDENGNPIFDPNQPPPVDENGNPIFDPNQPPPAGDEGPKGPPLDADGNPIFDPNQPPPVDENGNPIHDPNNPPPAGDEGPIGPPLDADGNPIQDPNQPPPAGDPNQPPPDGTVKPPDDGSQPPPAGDPNQPPPADGGGNQPPPPPPPDGSAPPPPPPDGNVQPPPQRVKIDTRNTKQLVALSGESSLVVVAAPESTNAKSKKARKVTASEGVYLTGKIKASRDSVQIPIIIDPSISGSSVKVTLAVENKVESTNIDIVDGAIQLITQLSDDQVQMSTANANVELSSKKLKGYLLAPGTSAREMQKAIKVKGKVTEGSNGQIINFNLPRKSLDSGIYTLAFRDGTQLYYGRVTIGELETKSITGTVLAPGGSL